MTNSTGDRTYNILIYGIDRKGLNAPAKDITDRNYRLVFEGFKTKKRFNEFDGVILFQGIFEDFDYKRSSYGPTYLTHYCYKDELDKRKNELALLLKNKGFICFILCEPFIDRDEDRDFERTDFTKVYLNAQRFYRKNFPSRIAHISVKRSEFARFLALHGAANSHFINHNDRIDLKNLATVNDALVGMLMWDERFFVPTLLPENTPERIEEYFRLLAEAITSTCNKLVVEVPAWAEAFKFDEELELAQEQGQLSQRMQEIDGQLATLGRHKRILVLDGDLLVDAVVSVLKEGLKLRVDDTDQYREDIRVLNVEGQPLVFGEIKGTNRGVKREHINQADSHRERAELKPDFPAILIINTHIKNARKLEEKDQEIASEQVRHAKAHNVLVLRTLDLLRLLRLVLKGKVSSDQVLTLLQEKSGWLRVSDEDWKIVEE
jgi:hypothetical protein